MLTTREPAVLILEDGRTFTGRAYGHRGATVGEAVFSTGMTGYQETLTDPSYHRQVVVMTAPHVGNTGWNDEDDESGRIWVAGYVVRDPALRPSNWRSNRALEDELDAQGVVGICDLDTRALTRHLRERGAMRVGIFSGDAASAPRERLLTQVIDSPPMAGASLAEQVTTDTAYVVPAVGEKRFTVAVVDLGIKAHDAADDGRARHRGARAAGHRHDRTTCSAVEPDGVFFSNGPGDPATAQVQAELLREVLADGIPLLRHLLRQPDPRPRPRFRHLQAEVRPPRHQPAGHGPHHRQGRGHRAQPRLRRRRAARPRHRDALRHGLGQPRLPQRRRRRGPRGQARRAAGRPSRCSTTRRPRPARTTPPTSSTGSSNS